MKSKLPQSTLLCLLLLSLMTVGCKFNKEENAAAQTAGVAAPPASYPDGGPSEPPAVKEAAAPPSGIKTTYSGLKYEVLKPGTGRQPTRYNNVRVNYRGYFKDGRTFDSNDNITFPLDRVVQGWQEGIPLMKEGAKYRFTVPPNLGYGAAGKPPSIPGNSTLMFDIELLEVKY